MTPDEFTANLDRVQDRIAEAARRSGRRAEEIRLIAVTKRQPVESIRAALQAGLNDLGENYVQETEEKMPSLPSSARWHLIGHLQTNKAKRAAELFDVVQSVDSLRIAQALGRQAAALGRTLEVLIQVRLGDEPTKTGCAPEEALEIAAQAAAIPGLSLQGLMGIAPLDGDPRPSFRRLRGLFEALPASYRQALSMGMSGDFETAIEEGATMVRLGTTLFGQRTP